MPYKIVKRKKIVIKGFIARDLTVRNDGHDYSDDATVMLFPRPPHQHAKRQPKNYYSSTNYKESTQWNRKSMIEEFCNPGWVKATGIVVKPGQVKAVKITVEAVAGE